MKKKTRFLLLIIAILVLLPLFAVASWLVTETMLKETSGEAFCGGCHSMKPFAAAYRENTHGGNNATGVRALCTDCHLPHDTLPNYLLTKARFGIHDAWAELTYDLDSIDWEAKRQHRESFVFDSGCLLCHAKLERASRGNSQVFVAHRPYFLGTTEKQCVSCHENVGHHDLSRFIAQSDNPGDGK